MGCGLAGLQRPCEISFHGTMRQVNIRIEDDREGWVGIKLYKVE